jgi:hypothetical protein
MLCVEGLSTARGRNGETYGFDAPDFLPVFEEFPAEALGIDSFAELSFSRKRLPTHQNRSTPRAEI